MRGLDDASYRNDWRQIVESGMGQWIMLLSSRLTLILLKLNTV